MNNSLIVIIDDDEDDTEHLVLALRNAGVKNELRCFDSSVVAWSYLTTTLEKICLIISDINMPKMSGIELRKRMNQNLPLIEKGIPFIFLSTTASEDQIKIAYTLFVQGFFQKPTEMSTLDSIAKSIIEYWTLSKLSHGEVS